MNSLRIFALTAVAISLLVACKNDPKSATSTETTAPPSSPKPEIYLYMVTVDKLNLRESSSQKSKVVTQFAEGDFVEGTGEVSSNTEEVVLRNVPYNEPYFRVTSTTPEQHNGWAYSAALELVYAGPRATSPDLGKLYAFSAFLKALDPKKLDSGKKAWDYVSQNLGNAQGTLADATFIILEQFLFRMEIEGNFYELTERVKWVDSDYIAIQEDRFDVNKYSATKQIAENGFRLEIGEGMVFPVVDWNKFGASFATRVTPPMKTYLERNIAEQKERMWSDGGIIIPLEKVADRAAWWEKFNKMNPYFVRSEETQDNFRGLVFMLTCGADNTPVFDWDTQAVTEDYQKVWAYIQQKYAGTDLGRSVKEMADLVAAEGGKRTEKVDAFLEKYMY